MRKTVAVQGIHGFVAALSMPNTLANSVGDQPIERYKRCSDDQGGIAAPAR